MSDVFRKTTTTARYAEWEAAGLRWLSEAADDGGPEVVRVLGVDGAALNLERVQPSSPSAAHAEQFGRALALMHGFEVPDRFGTPPGGWSGDGFFGPADDVLPLPVWPAASWGDFYAQQRVRHIVEIGCARGVFTASDQASANRVCERLAAGDFDDGMSPARCHGDLWSGNLMWTDHGVTLIDPAAHVAHPLCDIAMLHLFGAPHLERIVAAYDEVRPLADGWRERLGLHQLFAVAVHAVIFGGGYVRQTRELLRRFG